GRRLEGIKIQQLDRTVKILHQSRTGLDPIAAIIVGDRADLPDPGAVNMAAKDGIDRVSFRVSHDRVLKLADKIDGIFDALLRIRAERPKAQPQAAAHE